MPESVPSWPRRDGSAVPRIVLDTNVCLDLFVFNEPMCSHVLAAMRDGVVQAVTRDDCRDEWQRVLHYPRLPIDDAHRPAINAAFDAAFDALVQHLGDEGVALADVPLPRCADADDQKFLELAFASGAQWLLSKDRELLKLDARTRSAGWFPILLPQMWHAPKYGAPG